MSKDLCQSNGQSKWYDMSHAIEEYIKAEKKLNANVDFYSASTYHTLGIDVDLFTPIFAVSRISGWAAHVIEQLDDNRLIRPRADYIGPRLSHPLCADGTALSPSPARSDDARSRRGWPLRELPSLAADRIRPRIGVLPLPAGVD